ncbi:MAG: hypothetical protein K2I75_05385 [Clostridiales bacterium]|nr:hypothetical protein [Clostridiales bacterium]
MYSSDEGVSAYIKEMESIPFDEQTVVDNWDNVYRQLKHLRWMRNQLAHELDINTEFCEQDDIDCVVGFYNSILSGVDPLARIQQDRQQAANNPTPKSVAEEKSHKSWWCRLTEKIKSWFS